MTLRIANGAGFLGDNLDAPRRLLDSAQVDYLTLEYLAELTLSILARQREKDPALGYAEDFISVLSSIAPGLAERSIRVVTNAGGVNVRACATAAAKVLIKHGLGEFPIAAVTGDDLVERLAELQAAGRGFENLETGRPLAELQKAGKPIVSANAYLGARPIVEALSGGARLVITGRVADASLTLGPALHHYAWAWDDWPVLAGASVAGHLIECGAQCTGGLSHRWPHLHLAEVGYPIAEVEPDGSATITKPAHSGGLVNRSTVVEQLVYEIGDPAHYLTPDVNVDLTTVEVHERGPNRVLVRGASGRPPTDSYKLSLAYRDGFMAAGELLVHGRDCLAKARASAELVRARVSHAGYDLARWHVECLGAGEGVPGVHLPPAGLREVRLRIAVHDPRREAVERFARELAPLVTSGPPGIAGYAAGRPTVRPAFAYWPALVPKQFLEPRVEIRTAEEWAR